MRILIPKIAGGGREALPIYLMDTAYTTFITQDNDYIIELSKRRSIFSPNRIICNITFKNILGITILSLNISDIEIVNIIDNIYAYNEFGGNIIYSINVESSDMTHYFIGFSTEQSNNFLNGLSFETKDILTIYAYRNETMMKILSFNVSNSLESFCNTLYDVFIEDIDSTTKKELLGL